MEELSWLTQPDDLVLLPGDGSAVRSRSWSGSDLTFIPAIERISTLSISLAHRLQSVLQSSLGDPDAEDQASRAVAMAPQSATAYLVRAGVRHRAGNRSAAMADVNAGLALEPGDPRLLELRARLKTENGNPRRLSSISIAIWRVIPKERFAPREPAP